VLTIFKTGYLEGNARRGNSNRLLRADYESQRSTTPFKA
jgi:hypothetical protein